MGLTIFHIISFTFRLNMGNIVSPTQHSLWNWIMLWIVPWILTTLMIWFRLPMNIRLKDRGIVWIRSVRHRRWWSGGTVWSSSPMSSNALVNPRDMLHITWIEKHLVLITYFLWPIPYEGTCFWLHDCGLFSPCFIFFLLQFICFKWILRSPSSIYDFIHDSMLQTMIISKE